MLTLNFYKIRTGIDIRPIDQGGDKESQFRYDQIIQTISQKAEIEFIANNVYMVEEYNPPDLFAYKNTQIRIYVMIFAVDKTRSSWTASDLKTTFGNMHLSSAITTFNRDAQEWVGGSSNNISCESAYFDLRTKKKK